MNFSHYSDRPVELAVALVNTEQDDEDGIADHQGLTRFLEDYRDLWEEATQPPKASEVNKVKSLRAALREVFEADDEPAAAAKVNEILTSHRAKPRVSVHSGDPHLHFEPQDASMASWLGAVTAMGLATVMIEEGIERFGVCNSGKCTDVFVDGSRNRSRLHCSSTCSTREAVASYRKRQAD